MLVRIPFDSTETLFKRKGAKEMLKIMAKEKKVKIVRLAELAGVSVKTAWAFVKDLEKTEHIEKTGRQLMATERIQDDHIIVNLRDHHLAPFFKHDITPSLMLLLMKEHVSLKEASRRLSASYIKVKRAASLLRNSGIMAREGMKGELLVEVVDPLSMVPRKRHRQAIQHLLGVMKEQRPDSTEPIILYGDAAMGKNAISLDFLTLSRVAYPVEKHVSFLKGFVSAASSTTYQFGVIINVTFSSEDVWLAQLLGLVSNPHPIIAMAFDGINIHGRPPEAEDYFSLMNQAIHFSQERIDELLEKGYIINKNGKLVHTEKALQSWRAKSILYEQIVIIDGKSIKMIGITPPGSRAIQC